MMKRQTDGQPGQTGGQPHQQSNVKISKEQDQAQAYLQHSSGKDQSQGPGFRQVHSQGKEMPMRLLTALSHMALSHIFLVFQITSARLHLAFNRAARPLGGVGDEAADTPHHGEAKRPNPAETGSTQLHSSPFHRRACAPNLLPGPYCMSARHSHQTQHFCNPSLAALQLPSKAFLVELASSQERQAQKALRYAPVLPPTVTSSLPCGTNLRFLL